MPLSRENLGARGVKLRLSYADIGRRIGISADSARAMVKRRGWECLRVAGHATIVVAAASDLAVEIRNRLGQKRTNAKAPLRELACANGCGKLVLVRTAPGRFCETCRVLLRQRTTARYREANRARLRADNLAYFYANQERSAALRELRRAENPDGDKAARQAWFRNHKERWKVYEATRRAREIGATGSFTSGDLAAIIIQQQSRCLYCGCDVSGGRHTVDHYIPLARGGSNWPKNIVAACRPCNTGKHTTLPDEYIESRIRRGKPVADSWMLGVGR